MWILIRLKSGSAMFVCFVSLRPKSTAMVMAGRSVHLTHFFLGDVCKSTLIMQCLLKHPTL